MKADQTAFKVKPRTGGTGLRVGGTHDGEGTLVTLDTNSGQSVSCVDPRIYVTARGVGTAAMRPYLHKR